MARFAHGRTRFARSLRRRAREAGEKLASSYEFWFRRKYNLSPRDPRFLEATIEDILTDWWAYRYAENPNLEISEDDEFDVEEQLRRAEELAEQEAATLPLPNDFEDI